MTRFEQPPLAMEMVTDPVELAKAAELDAQFEKNWAWFEPRAADIYATHRGKCLCVAGPELFVADTPAEVLALARAAHPDDDGYYLRYIPKERAYRIYAH